MSAERLEGRNGKIWSGYISGRSQHDLAEEYGLAQSSVSEILANVRQSIPDTDRTDAAIRSVERLHQLSAAHMPNALDGSYKATQTVLQIENRLAKLLGLDAVVPMQVQLQQRSEATGQIVAHAVTAAVDALPLSPELRFHALTAAQAALNGEPVPAPLALPAATPARSVDDLIRAHGLDPEDLDGGDDDDE